MLRARAAGLTAVVGLLVLAVAFGIAGARRSVHPLGNNLSRPAAFVAIAEKGETICQNAETVPDGTAGIVLRAGTFGKPGPRLQLRFDSPGAAPLRGTLAAGWREGDIVVPVPKSAELPDRKLCITNDGPARLALAGVNVGGGYDASVGTTLQQGRVRVIYRPKGAQSWWGHAPRLVTDVGRVRASFPGAATLPLAFVFMLVAVGGAVALVVRTGNE